MSASISKSLSRTFTPSIPVLNIKDFYSKKSKFVQELAFAFRHMGFVGITDTNIDSSALNRLYGASRRFFHLKPQEKEEISGKEIGGERGYIGTSESPVGRKIGKTDIKEFMHFGRELSVKKIKRDLDIP